MRQHICNKTAFDRAKKGCSAARMGLNFDEVFERDGSIADSQQAARILKAVDGVLDEDDVDLIITMLEKAGKLTSNEAQAAKEALHGATMNEAVEESLALDQAHFARRGTAAMFPHMNRLKSAGMEHDGRGLNRPVHAPKQSAIEERRYAVMFPHAGRLK